MEPTDLTALQPMVRLRRSISCTSRTIAGISLPTRPSYEAVPVIRAATPARFPAARAALAALGGTLAEAAMQHLNYLVDVEKRPVRDVAAEWRARRE